MKRLLIVASSLLAVFAVASPRPDNVASAIEQQRAFVEAHPTDAHAWNDLGNLLVLGGARSEGEAAYRKALEEDPTIAAARFNLGLLLQETGEDGEAESVFQDLVELWPRHARAHYQLGVLLEARDDRRDAIDQYARAFALDPELSFVEHNPYVLESELTTEGLIRASRYVDSAAEEIPRDYEDVDRIRDLWLETRGDAEQASQALVPESQRRAEEGSISVESGEGEVKAGGSSAVPRSPVRFDEGRDGAGTSSGQTRAQAEERGRAVDGADGNLSGNAGVVGVVPVAVPSPSAASPTRETGRAARGALTDRGDGVRGTSGTAGGSDRDRSSGRVGGGSTAGGTVTTPGVSTNPRAPGTRRPGRTSTGRLDLRLIPLGPDAPDDVRAG